MASQLLCVSLIRREQQRRSEYALRPTALLPRVNDAGVFVNALKQIEKLKAILERKDHDGY